mgnify:CR=1 FL=1
MKLIVGNQKNYLTFEKAQEFVKNFKDVSNKNIVICPSYIYLDMFKKLNIQIGAQNVSKYEENIVTADISIAQLKSMNINISIVGHSERRQLLNETISDTNKKVKELGLKNTQFKNCTGLDEEGHYSTAYDMAVIARELLKHEDILKFSSKYEDYLRVNTPNKFWLVNTNKVVYKFYNNRLL